MALLLCIIGGMMMMSVVVSSLMDDKPEITWKLLAISVGTLAVSFECFRTTRRRPGEQRFRTGARDGYASVTLGWLLCSFVAAIPFYVCSNMTWADSIFESCSGLTTTGASVMTPNLNLRTGFHLVGGIEGMPKGVLFWRSTLNWLGGVGIVFFIVMILPLLKVGYGKQLYNAEVPGLKTAGDQMTSRLATSVKWTLAVYLSLTLLSMLTYWALGMTLYDAINHSFTTVSTGGFSTKNDSLAYYNDHIPLQWAVILFMFLAACNFGLMVKLFSQRKFSFFSDEEFRFFGKTALFAIIFTAAVLYIRRPDELVSLGSRPSFQHGVEAYLRTSAFHVVTAMSTTGYMTSDWNTWNAPCLIMLFMLLMFPCGCGGSTCGGIKYSRIIIILKQFKYEIRHCIFPNTIQDVRLNGERIEHDLIRKTLTFIILYVSIFVAVAAVLSLEKGVGVAEAFSGSLTCLSNVGPGYGNLGPAFGFDWLSPFSKYLLALTMIIGRLELYSVLVLFLPSFWKR